MTTRHKQCILAHREVYNFLFALEMNIGGLNPEIEIYVYIYILTVSIFIDV